MVYPCSLVQSSICDFLPLLILSFRIGIVQLSGTGFTLLFFKTAWSSTFLLLKWKCCLQFACGNGHYQGGFLKVSSMTIRDFIKTTSHNCSHSCCHDSCHFYSFLWKLIQHPLSSHLHFQHEQQSIDLPFHGVFQCQGHIS